MSNDLIPFLISAFGFAAAPALLQIAAAFVGWLKRPPGLPVGRQSQRPRETSLLNDLRISVKQSVEVPSAPPGTPIAELRDEAERINERVRRVHIVATLVSAAVVSSLFLVFTSRTFLPSIRVGLAYAFLAPQLLILFWVIRLPMRGRLLIFLAHIVAGVVLLLLFTPRGFVWWVVAWQYIKVALIPVPGMLILFNRRNRSSIPDVLAALLYFLGSGFLLDRFRYTATIGSGQAVLDTPWLIPLALGVVVFGVAGAWFLIVQKRRSLHALAAVAGVIGAVLLDRNIARQDLPPAVSFACFLAFAVLQALIVWYLSNAFGWIAKHGFFTSELVHIHINWFFLLAAYVVATTLVQSRFYRDAKAVRWGMLALILSIFTLYALLVTASLLHRSPPRKRLLLLRVFGRLNEREDLLDDLDDTWRRIGTVELLAASDVASRLLELRDLEFLENNAAVDDEIRRRRTRFGADARYPVNAFFCHQSVWFYAFTMLAEPSDVVMMDLRGFTTSNAGCVDELGYLLEESKKPLERVVLLVDHDSDLRALDEKAVAAGVAEKLTVLDFGKRPSDERRRAMFELLLAAAKAPH